MGKIKKPGKTGTRIPTSATEKKLNYNEAHGKFTFSSVCDHNCLLSGWQKDELQQLIGCFKKVERLLWKEILKDPGLNYESHKFIDLARPEKLPPDASLDSIRVSQRMRLYGYRTQDVFNIIWFDREHIVCPEGKTCRYAI